MLSKLRLRSVTTLNALANNRSTAIRLQSTDNKLSYAFNQYGKLDVIGTNIGAQLAQIAHLKPNDLAYKFCLTQQSFTFEELHQRVSELAQSLLSMGFKKGDKIAVLLPNIPETPLITLAAASIGVVSVIMNPAYQLYEIEYMLSKTGVKGIFMLDNLKTLQHYELMKKICPELEHSTKGELNSKKLPALKHVVIANLMPTKETESKYKGTWSFNEVSKHSTANMDTPYVDFDDAFAMMFTSGSTGFPKAALLHHSAIVNTSRFIQKFSGCQESFANICMPIPIFHIFGLTTGIISSITNGNSCVFPHIFPETLSTIKAIASEKCTAIKGAPTIFMDIVNHPELKNYDISSLETMLIGAATVPKDLLLNVKEKLQLKNIIIGYAQTETGCAGSLTNANDVNVSEKGAYESIGKNFIEMKIRDTETNQIVPIGTDGEICFRGFSIMKGYHDEPEKTKETIDEDGWIATGDIGNMDEDGFLYFKSRQKEMVIRGGVNIYPPEVEKFLRTHPGILDCYVVGLPDERVGEELAVWIKRDPQAEKKITEEDMREFCKGNIAFFKVPRYVKFVDEFPVSATAKVQKFKIIDQMKKELNL